MNEQKISNNRRSMLAIGIVVAVVGFLIITLSMRKTPADLANINPHPAIGPENTLIVIKEYSDFQCPYCKKAQTGLKALLEKYPTKIRLEFIDFPLRKIHQNSYDASSAAQCALKQGKFWEFHDKLFVNQESWASALSPVSKFESYAGEIGLDVNKFRSCYKDKLYRKTIDANIKEGVALDVNGTPTFFVNNERIVPPLTLQDWESALSEYLNPPAGPRSN